MNYRSLQSRSFWQ